MKQKRYFNTSGPNNPEEHYTLMRANLVKQGNVKFWVPLYRKDLCGLYPGILQRVES